MDTKQHAEHNEQPEANNATTSELEHCLAQMQEYKERNVRLLADFENFKKRTDKEKAQWIANAQSGLLYDILAIVDDIDRAFAQQTMEASQSWLAGFDMIRTSLYKLLEKYNVYEITQVTIFDPHIHEAIAHVAGSQLPDDTIVQVLQKGFMYKDQVLRPAKVSVAKEQ